MRILSASQLQENKVNDFFIEHWGSPEMVISSGIFDCTKLKGFAVVNEKEVIVGYITYVIGSNECEIISLDSIEEGKGIGSALLQKVEQTAKEEGCNMIKLITTNDNLHALKFYQKRGYYLTELYRGAVVEARKLKPEIPDLGNDGIPVHDEILLTKLLD
ncbi:GNAT family N-acetyltransferase [Pseudobacillus sp. 179-B 2D1 NHS]|uniref:GNAT family N-acetyltransferase n=1 Tax=Pseudobacillus sp. 179-B 2D1 NHS TaxID=3374292 RepID=UPI003878FA5D